jgi:hypothetical protein
MERPLDNHIAFDGSANSDGGAHHDSERRRHARNVRVMRIARLSDPQLDTEGLGMVRDVSSGGMMIDASFELELGQPVSIALLDDHELTGVVAWKEGTTVGVSFLEELPVEQILARPSLKPDGQRARLPRFAADKQVQLCGDAVAVDAILLDISQRGAKMRGEGKFKVHGNILIRPTGLRPVGATIKWRAADMMGVEFHRLLSVDELDSWLKTG